MTDFSLESMTVPEPNTGCMLWTGPLSKGYGRLYRGYGRKGVGAHRLSYERYVGPIPNGYLVCHKCDTPACINPAHLFVGTYLDNSRDAVRKGRIRRGDEHGCRRHPERVARGDASGMRTHPESRSRGSQHGMAKISEADILTIRRLLREGLSQREVGARVGITQPRISDIARGKTWTHVP